ncbi:MAG: type I methionyl aminopeptidase [Bacilli bacterium]|nr:type I methionyl aminopeptidase [Bacilli bacterium]
MISIKTDEEIKLMAEAGNIVYNTFKHLEEYIKEGITTLELDELAYNYILSRGAYPSFKGYNGYPNSICTSVNEQIVHGIPNNYKLCNGDIISIDVGACYKGYHGDSAVTYKVGDIDKDKAYLMEHTKRALYTGLEEIKPGKRLGDVSHRIEAYAKKHNLGVVKELVGHGIGKNMHEAPDIPNYGKRNTGTILKEGMTLAIEPMLTLGSPSIKVESDNWTISTLDKSPAAHFEHTIVITKNGYKILTGE